MCLAHNKSAGNCQNALLNERNAGSGCIQKRGTKPVLPSTADEHNVPSMTPLLAAPDAALLACLLFMPPLITTPPLETFGLQPWGNTSSSSPMRVHRTKRRAAVLSSFSASSDLDLAPMASKAKLAVEQA